MTSVGKDQMCCSLGLLWSQLWVMVFSCTAQAIPLISVKNTLFSCEIGASWTEHRIWNVLQQLPSLRAGRSYHSRVICFTSFLNQFKFLEFKIVTTDHQETTFSTPLPLFVLNKFQMNWQYPFLICMILIWIYVMNHAQLVGGWARWPDSCLAVLRGKNFNIWHFLKLFNQYFHTSHAYRHHQLLPFYTTFTDLNFAWGHKVGAQQNLSASVSHTLFIWYGWNLMWWWSSSNWTSWD